MAGEGSGVMLMERTWEKIQQKTFTKWVNSHLRKKKTAIENLQTDLADGVQLIQFLEIISNQTFSKYEKKPRIRIQKIGNVNSALEFLKQQRIQLVNISAEDIVDENLKLILGLIWTIIQKFQIEDISEEQLSAKEALLLWCQKKTAGYRDVKVDNFTYSWQDGLAFCALIHKHRPDLLDFNSLDKNNKAANLQLAFEVADRDLGIPKLLDIEDMVDIKPDERSVITYVSQYYHVFSKYNQAEVAGRRIGKLIDVTSQNDALKNDYNDKARRLVDWLNQVTPALQDRTFDNTLDGIKNKIDEFKNFRNNDKPPKAADKATVEALFTNIAIKLRNNNRPAFEPPKGLGPSDIEALWDKLGSEEREREKALYDELRRQEKLDHLKRRFNLKAGKFEAWLDAKEHYLSVDEPVDSLNEAQTKLKNHDAFDEEYAGSKGRLETLQQLTSEILALTPPDAAEIKQRSDNIGNRWTGLADPQVSKREDLQKKLEKEQKKEELRKEFAKQAKEYKNWNKEQSNSVNDYNFGDNLEAVEAYKAKLDADDSNITSTSGKKKDSLDKLWDEMEALGVKENRYTPLTNKDIASLQQHLLEELQQRRAAYDIELARQRNMEEKRKEFAKKAQEFVDSLNNRKGEISRISGDPETAANAIRDTYQDGKSENDGLSVLSSLQEELASLGIRDNKYTTFTLPILQNQVQKFSNYVRNLIAALNDEKELKAEYNARAQQLVDWINVTSPKLKERNFDNTLAGIREQHTEWQKYLTTEKAKKDIDKIHIEGIFNKISTLLAANNRPAFEPVNPLDQASINGLWASLNTDEKEREVAIGAELARQEKLDTLVKRFNSDATELEGWFNDKEAYINAKEEVDTLETARMKTKFLEVFNAEFASKNPALNDLKSLNSEIASLNYHGVDTINARTKKIEDSFARFHQLAETKGNDLKSSLEHQQKLEDLRISFANQARDFNKYVRDNLEVVGDHHFGFTLEEVIAYQAELDKSDNDINNQADNFKSRLDQISNNLSSAGITDNRHTNLKQDDVSNLRNQLSDALSKRRQAYQTELSRQNTNEEKRKNFAEKAQNFINWVEAQKNSLQTLDGTPEARIDATNAIYQGGEIGKGHVSNLEALDTDMKNAGIFDNKYSPFTLPVIVTRNKQYDTSVSNFITGLNEEKELNERAAAQQAEYEHKLKLENLKLNYSKEASALNLFLEGSNETLTDPIKCDSPADVGVLLASFNELVAEKPSQTDRYNNVVKLASDVSAAGITDFGSFPLDVITTKWENFLKDFDLRKSALEAEQAKQNNNEELRVSFANTAKQLNSFIESQLAAINSAPHGSLEEQLKDVQSRKSQINEAQGQVSSLSQLNREIEEAGVTSNPHTDLTFASIKVNYDQLVKVTTNKETLLQKEILAKSNTGVSAEQLAEFKEVFEHFDKDRMGSLSRLEFKSCLQSLGEDPTDAELDKTIATIGQNGRVDFNAFCSYMSQKVADSDTKDQILEAFKVLAGDKAFVSEDDLRRALPAEKVQYLVANMPLYQGQAGNYDYSNWSSSAFSR